MTPETKLDRLRRERDERQQKERITAWVKDRVRRIDHEIKLQQIRNDSEARQREITETFARRRRAEEELGLSFLEGDVAFAKKMGRAQRLTDLRRLHRVKLHRTATTPACDAEFIDLWRAHVDELALRYNVSIVWERRTLGANAYAWPSMSRIEAAPIIDASSYAVLLHELGHIAKPCEPTHTRVTTTLNDSLCIACEVSAWHWAIDTVRPFWTRTMHQQMADALTTYSKYATDSERHEINEMVSPIGFRRVMLRRAIGDSEPSGKRTPKEN
jgi:hypothetical protein